MSLRKRYGRMQGATLIEVLVSMSLLSMIFVVFGMIWIQVNGQDSAGLQQRYRLKARMMLDSAQVTPESFVNVVEYEGITYVKELRQRGIGNQLREAVVTVYGSGRRVLFRRGRVIHVE